MSKEKEKLSFIFPDIIAKMMKNVDMRTQMESSMISMFLILIGMFLMAIYMVFFSMMSIVYKGLLIFNLFCAFIFISSFLVTTYQQYVFYMNTAGIDPEKHKAEIKKRGNIFKRIKLAIQNRKKRKKNIKSKRLDIIDEAIDNMIKIKKEELEDLKKIDNQNSASQDDNRI